MCVCVCSAVLQASLIRCMRSIADTYHHEVLETTLPEPLFAALVDLLRVTHRGIHVHVHVHCMSVPCVYVHVHVVTAVCVCVCV